MKYFGVAGMRVKCFGVAGMARERGVWGVPPFEAATSTPGAGVGGLRGERGRKFKFHSGRYYRGCSLGPYVGS